eukprot:TRINITY_DN14302_c0_g1_i1.p1 TRINITY_DN14302_c0_g1~~TRINITY_DN14302_c0_g1_i1.p1  ORF type:complete len:979 (+),score=236.77 TRINITY_DN14302_c0_g1_i1:194-3130(+)
MHGVKREDYKAQQQEARQEARRAKMQERLERLREQEATVLAKRKEGCTDEEVMKETSRLLMENIELHTIWNYRREILLKLLPKADVEEKQTLLQAELGLVFDAMQQNPKIYVVWYHRKWIISLRMLPPEALTHELKLCAKLLMVDSRNFHCWNYRRYISAIAGCPAEKDVEFTISKINENFSNYSAWHLRSRLLPSLSSDEDCTAMAQEELELVKSAFFTEPADQSAWLYHRWLLGSDWWRSEAGRGDSPVLVGSSPGNGELFVPSTRHNDFCIGLVFSAAVQQLDGGGVVATTSWQNLEEDRWPLEWEPILGNSKGSRVWIGRLPKSQKVLPGSSVRVSVTSGVRLWGPEATGAVPSWIEFKVATDNEAKTHQEDLLLATPEQLSVAPVPKTVMTEAGCLAAHASVRMSPLHKQAITLQFGTPVQISQVAVAVAGIERIGFWSPQPTKDETGASAKAWRFNCITPPLSPEEVDGEIKLTVGTQGLFDSESDNPADAVNKISLQKLEVSAGDDAEDHIHSFTQIVLGEIHCCRELLDLEPRTKWPQLTLASLMVLVGWPVTHAGPLLENLAQDDPMRARYYDDFGSQLRIRGALEKLSVHSCAANLSRERLTTMVSNSGLCVGLRSLDLSHNLLESTASITGGVLPLLESLDLGHNKLVKIAGGTLSSLPRLVELSLASNDLATVEGLRGCRTIAKLELGNNPRLEDCVESVVGLLMEGFLDANQEDRRRTPVVSGLADKQQDDDDPEKGLIRLSNGWVFSSDLKPKDLDQIRTLISVNGLTSFDVAAEPLKPGSDAEAADAAFAAMVAANPDATVIGEPPAQTPEEYASAADAAFAKLMEKFPDATVHGNQEDRRRTPVVSGLADKQQDDDDPEKGLIRLSNGWVFSSDLKPKDLDQIRTLISVNGLTSFDVAAEPLKPGSDAEAADAAFAAMVAANPDATVIGEPPAQTPEEYASAADAAFAKLMEKFPDATVVQP